MDIKTILGVTSAIVGTGVVLGQDPSFEYPPVQPILTSGKGEVVETADVQDKQISVRFKDASAEEVLDWLSNQGVSFVTSGIPKDARVSLNVSNTPLKEVIALVGEALGGTFVKRGTTYVFQQGIRSFAVGGSAPMIDRSSFKDLKGFKELEGMSFAPMEMKFSDMEGFKAFNMQDPKNAQQMKEMHEKMLKEFGPNSDFMKQMHKEMGNAKDHARFFNHQGDHHKDMKGLSEQDAKKWEEFGKRMEKQFGPSSDFEKKMKHWGEQHGKTMEKQFGPGSRFEKEMKVWGEQHGKTMEKQFGPGSKFEKEMKVWGEHHGKTIEKHFGPGSDFEKKMRAFKMENEKVRELSAKEHQQMMKELELKMKDMKFVVPPIPKMDGKTFVMPPMPKMDGKAFQVPVMPKMPAMPAMPAVGFHSSDITQITKSLSAAQREKNKRQGFLYWSDLTKEQQAKLGMGSWTGNWTISYSKDGEAFTIKSDK